ncbi:hypothetical protein GCM10010249_06180 [Streptomyces roseolilacinus]|uniref:Uncharacterized protein n=1 Tax=Streptomyces roseolilacinus TaxID=66904 RepID=A0A918AW89_9ACTN|nr:hypothetical protein GCM10010249_06180 [Streptomyces roseolilacinus]
MPDQGLARLGQAHLAAGADEQGRAGGGLQGLHLLADGRLGAAQLSGRGGEGAGGGHGAEDSEVTGFDHSLEYKGPFKFARNMTWNLWAKRR